MDHHVLRTLLEQLQAGQVDVPQVLERIALLPYEEPLGFAVLDHHRAWRKKVPEVIFGEGKTSAQLITLLERLRSAGQNALATRVDPEKGAEVLRSLPDAEYHAVARALTVKSHEPILDGRGPITVVTAGTSDLPVAEEAALTAEFFGNEVRRITDVGVAGLHRLLNRAQSLREATVLIVVAGMEGALPSVVAGMVSRPVIAVPTSVGYGASFGGLAALLAMLNSCASGITVVNIDNGFGAAYAAHLINRI